MTEQVSAIDRTKARVPLTANLLDFIAVSRSRLSPAEELEALLISISLKAPRRAT